MELRFARPRDLQGPPLGTLFVLSGQVIVQTIVADGPPAPQAEFDDVTQLFVEHVTDPARELRVREGERVHRGQLLARLTYRGPELERRRQHAAGAGRREDSRPRPAGSEGSTRRGRSVGAQLAAVGALEREEAALVRAREAAAQARRDLERVADEARRATEVRAPVDGQVLTIRVHVIHGNESTALIRLLYQKDR